MKRPIIAVTCPWSVETWGDSIEEGGYYYVGRPYVEMISKLGGIPILVAPEYNEKSLSDYIDAILNVSDGILFSGGGDVKRESSKNLPTLKEQQKTRYNFESSLMRSAYEKELPILGICRGFQMIVEVFGGSLSDEIIENHSQNISGSESWHEVLINKESKLYELIETEVWSVNSFHIQKVEKVPENFIISARAKDGVIEGVEANVFVN